MRKDFGLPFLPFLALLPLAVLVGCAGSTSESDYQVGNSIKKSESAPSAMPVPANSMAPPPMEMPAGEAAGEGEGPQARGDNFEHLVENDFQTPQIAPLSTFSIDVDTASYSKVRQMLLENKVLPPPDAVRIEELINYFNYEYAGPEGGEPFATHVSVTECPWKPAHRLARIGLQGRVIENESRPSSNLVFLLDVSGSMSQPNKLPLLQQGLKMMVDRLGENDRVAIVVYAGAAGLVLPSTTCDQKTVILDSLDALRAGGSTNGAQGIQLAYQTALDNFVKGGVNRVILCTDGDFNVGTTSTGGLVRLAEEKAKAGVFLSVLGFGSGNLNDAMLEQLSNKANGNYSFIDSKMEAKKVLCEQISSTLVTIAKDVKIQVEFNPAVVAAYRLIGYENRMLAAQDFNDDTKDAGEIGAGHSITALYEIVPVGAETDVELPSVDKLKYKQPAEVTSSADEMMTVKLRYKLPDEDESSLLSIPVENAVLKFGEAGSDFRFAAAVAQFGMLLRNSKYKGDANYGAVLEIATESAKSDNPQQVSYRQQFIALVDAAQSLKR